MPYKIANINGSKYRVYNANTGEIRAKGTTLEKAKRQIRLLYCIKSGGCKR